MAEFGTKFGKVYAEKSEGGASLGFHGKAGSGFFSLPLPDRRSLLHAALTVGSALLLRPVTKRRRAGEQAVRRRQKEALEAMKAPRRGTFAGKRRRK